MNSVRDEESANVSDVVDPAEEQIPVPSNPSISQLERVLLWGAVTTSVILLVPLVSAFIKIFFVRYPYIGYSDNMVADAEAVARGHLQYGNPAMQFVGTGYTPLFTWLVAGLLKIYWWIGWAPVVSMLAALVSMATITRLLWAHSRQWRYRLIAASFIVVLSLGSLSALPASGLFPTSALEEGRPDQLAWCLLVVASVRVFRGFLSDSGSTPIQMFVTGLLLAGSVGTKQTTLVPCLVAAAIAVVMPHLIEAGPAWRPHELRKSLALLGGFIGSLIVLGVILQVASHGYALDRMFFGQIRASKGSLSFQVRQSLGYLILPLLALAILVVCVAVARRTNPKRSQRRDFIVALAAVVLALGSIPTAILAEAKVGGAPNQLVGPVWLLTLACAVLLLLVRSSVGRFVMVAIPCCVLLVGIVQFSWSLSDQVGLPNLHQSATWSPIDKFLINRVNAGQAIYDPLHPSLSVSPKSPNYPAGDVNDIFLAGYTPRWFINNLLSGRYALVAQLESYVGPGTPTYDSNDGRYDESTPWKIDLLLQMGYSKVTDPDSGVVYYRPTSRARKNGLVCRLLRSLPGARCWRDDAPAGPGGTRVHQPGSAAPAQGGLADNCVCYDAAGGRWRDQN